MPLVGGVRLRSVAFAPVTRGIRQAFATPTFNDFNGLSDRDGERQPCFAGSPPPDFLKFWGLFRLSGALEVVEGRRKRKEEEGGHMSD